MPTFNYSTGNPANLVAGGSASMSDIQGSLTDLRAGINGQLDEVNVPNLSAAFTTYRKVGAGSAQLTTPAATTFILGSDASGAFTDVVVAAGGSAKAAFWFDPAYYAANTRTTKLRLVLTTIVNAVVPTVNLTLGMNQVATIGGASGNAPTIASIGGSLSGSTVTANVPATGVTTVNGSDFNAPTNGAYCLTVLPSGPAAAGSVILVQALILMRQV